MLFLAEEKLGPILEFTCKNTTDTLLFRLFLLGISPMTIRGTNTAVYVGCGLSETWEALSTDDSNVTGYSPLGCTTSMFANRISFAFDLKG